MKAEISRDVHGDHWLNRVREHQVMPGGPGAHGSIED
jgi:hypothetical protein